MGTSGEGVLADYEAVRRLLALYGQLLDSKRMRAWGELFTRDATFRVGDETYAGREKIVEAFGAMQPETPVQHAIFSPVIEMSAGGSAQCWTDMAALLAEGAGVQVVTIARYHDEVAKSAEDGRWRFARRVLVMSGDPIPSDVTPSPDY